MYSLDFSGLILELYNANLDINSKDTLKAYLYAVAKCFVQKNRNNNTGGIKIMAVSIICRVDFFRCYLNNLKFWQSLKNTFDSFDLL